MISIGGLHDLDPLDGDLVGGTVMLGLIGGDLGALSETVNTGTPVNEELKLLFELGSDDLEHILSEFSGVVRDLWLELAGVLVDTLDLLLIEVDPEVVREHLELPSWCIGISGRLLWEKSKSV